MAAQTLIIPVMGMDCAGCVRTVQQAISSLPGVQQVDVLLTSEKATITFDPAQIDMPTIRKAITDVGYTVPVETSASAGGAASAEGAATASIMSRRVLTLFGVVFGVILFIVVAGEWFGLFETLSDRIPLPIGAAVVLITGFPIFRKVVKAALRRQVISHTLMSLGVVAALAIGQWATAVVIVFFMRVGEYAEHFTTERARQAVKRLTKLAPLTARVERDGREQEIAVAEVSVGEVVIVRPGESIPVDGTVINGRATINLAAITGESMPVDASEGTNVFAATIATLGSLRIQATRVGKDTTFGRVITMVEEAEAHRADVQRIADKFSAYYLPVVAGIALLTFIFRRDPLATAAVLVVACSCSFALATPIAMLASIGAAAKRGLLIKGGKYIEVLAKADVLLLDKTGTLTLGQPRVTDVVTFNGVAEQELLALAASVERNSEHPLAEAVRTAAQERKVLLTNPADFIALPGVGVRARIGDRTVSVGSHRLLNGHGVPAQASALEAQGKSLLYVLVNNKPVGILAAADTMRGDVPGALAELREQGLTHIELLTGDNERTAAAVAGEIGVSYRANLLPEDKIRIVKDYQAQGKTVVMIGDGVNDAPALAQANVGIAMGVAGTDVAIEAAHVALLQENWTLIPELFAIAKRTMGVVRFNIGFTTVYNIIGLTLAAFGILPPILAAAAQSLPDLGILANSSRLLRAKNDSADNVNTTSRLLIYVGIGAALLLVLAVILTLILSGEDSMRPALRRGLEAVVGLVAVGAFIGVIAAFVVRKTGQVESQIEAGVMPESCCSSDTCSCGDTHAPVVSLMDIPISAPPNP